MTHKLTNVNVEAKTATCSVCGEVPIKRYCLTRHGKTRWKCFNQYKQQYTERSFDRYGIDREKYRKFISDNPTFSDNRKCDICGKDAVTNGKGMAIDHCHETGDTRGHLCNSCNLGLGSFKDNVDILKKAVKYLKNYENRITKALQIHEQRPGTGMADNRRE